MTPEQRIKHLEDELAEIKKQLNYLPAGMQGELNKINSALKKLREDIDILLKDVKPHKH